MGSFLTFIGYMFLGLTIGVTCLVILVSILVATNQFTEKKDWVDNTSTSSLDIIG